MPNLKIISDINEITLNNRWTPAIKFKNKDRLVDENGRTVSSEYMGRRYRIVEKRERTFSGIERFGRGLLGTIAVICTLCLGLFSKSIRNLFTNSKESICFAILQSNDKSPLGKDLSTDSGSSRK